MVIAQCGVTYDTKTAEYPHQPHTFYDIKSHTGCNLSQLLRDFLQSCLMLTLNVPTLKPGPYVPECVPTFAKISILALITNYFGFLVYIFHSEL